MNTKIGEKEFLNKFMSENLGLDLSKDRDDCIIREINKSISLIYSIDRPELIPFHGEPHDVLRKQGRWCAAHVINDVIACGVKPKGISFDIGIYSFSELEDISQWAKGVLDICKKYNMKYEGGNLSTEQGISGIAWGVERPERIIRRSGAVNGSTIVATANIGLGWAYKLISESGIEIDESLQKRIHEYKDFPFIKLNAFQEIWSFGAINSGMDLTDGIIEFGYEILEQSNFGVEIIEPSDVHQDILYIAELMSLPKEAFLFDPGYDTPFAHGWCIKNDLFSKVKSVLQKYEIPFTEIGHVSKSIDGVYYKSKKGEHFKLPRYWDDVLKDRGSRTYWEEQILPLFEKKNYGNSF